MKINAINSYNFAPKSLKVAKNSQKENQISNNSTQLLNFTGVFYSKPDEKKILRTRAKNFQKKAEFAKNNAMVAISNLNVAHQKAKADIDKSYDFAKDEIKKSYDLATMGLKNGFFPVTLKNEGHAQFEVEKVRGKILPKSVLEFDSEGNLLSVSNFNGITLESIEKYNSESVDIIQTEGLEPSKIYKNYKSQDEFEKAYSADAVYKFEKDKKAAFYGVQIKENIVSFDEKYAFENDKIKEISKGQIEYKNGGKYCQMSAKYDNILSDFSPLIKEINSGVFENADNSNKVTAKTIFAANGKTPDRILKNYEKTVDGVITTDESYYYSGEDVYCIKINAKENKNGYSAREIFQFVDDEPICHKKNCQMEFGKRNYESEKKTIL